jgi:pimeloyl-ACP methyl ester carboxylesterase
MALRSLPLFTWILHCFVDERLLVRRRFVRWWILVALLAGCSRDLHAPPLVTDPDHARPGAVASIESVSDYPAWALRALVWWRDLTDQFPIDYGVSLYRVGYWTTGLDGAPTLVSGLIALPRRPRLRGVVSYQHGTETDRASAPSMPGSPNGILAAAAFAARGYLLAAPDYVGLGTSARPHPYLHAVTEANAVIDLLRAARTIVDANGDGWPSRIMLVGFSQGGHATLAAQRALEANPVDGLGVVASASIAGPFDLAAISFPNALEGASTAATTYLAYLLNSYSHIYGEPLDSALRDPYSTIVPALFDGSHGGDDVIAALPRMPRDMFRTEFLTSYADGAPNWLRERLVENSLDDWSPRAPIHLYFGSRDVDVSPHEATVEAERLTHRGGDVVAIDVGPVDHNGSVAAAVPSVTKWFDSLAAPAQ